MVTAYRSARVLTDWVTMKLIVAIVISRHQSAIACGKRNAALSIVIALVRIRRHTINMMYLAISPRDDQYKLCRQTLRTTDCQDLQESNNHKTLQEALVCLFDEAVLDVDSI